MPKKLELDQVKESRLFNLFLIFARDQAAVTAFNNAVDYLSFYGDAVKDLETSPAPKKEGKK